MSDGVKSRYGEGVNNFESDALYCHYMAALVWGLALCKPAIVSITEAKPMFV
jgi:hypothetical protein